MRKIYLSLFFIVALCTLANAQNNRLSVAGNIQADTLYAKGLKINSGTDTTLLTTNGSNIKIGANLYLKNGTLNGVANTDTNYLKANYITLKGDQTIGGTQR